MSPASKTACLRSRGFEAQGISYVIEEKMCGCQNYGTLLGPHYSTAPNI